ncbi:uncharacterized protein LOC106011430 [Aplysia californica]|uniref:Uncharacterized protein LOC106011430 n=1 Tax=Aplysia californica TaxID=6500 RepID=A0ABM0ZXG4_APLCA|nr:uncharacterized protein LOC106011430 [Aplysia californica]
MTNGKLLVLAELVECVACAICADGHALFSCDSESQVLTHISRNDIGEIVFGATEPVGLGTSLAASVAFSKEPSRLKDLLGDRRVPDGLTVSTNRAQSAMGLPVADDTEICIGVVEFYRYAKYSQFSEEEEEVASLLMVLGCTALAKAENVAQRLVDADRASLFLVDHHTNELYARIFDMGYDKKRSLPPAPDSDNNGTEVDPGGAQTAAVAERRTCEEIRSARTLRLHTFLLHANVSPSPL